jgi:hypothetical protein
MLQVWKGGATDLSTRKMIEEPPRWLVLAEYNVGQQPPETPGCLLTWDLERSWPNIRRAHLTPAA